MCRVCGSQYQVTDGICVNCREEFCVELGLAEPYVDEEIVTEGPKEVVDPADAEQGIQQATEGSF
jgi:hypothetical protein